MVDEDLSDNLQQVELGNGLPPSGALKAKQTLDFTVDMETGTGKAYVYLRTVLELNQPYPARGRAAACGRRHRRQRQEGARAHIAHVPPALLGEPSTL